MVSKSAYWTGIVLSVLVSVMLALSAVMKFVQPGDFQENFTKMGFDLSFAVPLGIIELACVVFYVIPRTAVLGAVLIAGYMGGAIVTHLRLHDYMVVAQTAIGVVAWLGLYLRDERIRALLPLRS